MDGFRVTLSQMIEDTTAPDFVEKKRILDDEYLLQKCWRVTTTRALLIEKYLNYIEIPYSKELLADAKAIINVVAVILKMISKNLL